MPIESEELSDHVFQQISSFLNSSKATKILLGYSGGLDSTVLLHVVANLDNKLNSTIIEPIHINHGVNQSAQQWAMHCGSFCKKLGLPLTIRNYSLDEIKSNREATYRQARYESFANDLGESDLLLTAHHQQDQAETVLFNLFRGAGVSGLRGMEALREFAGGFHLRPLLFISPKCLIEYARHYNLAWIDDPSNEDLGLDRNYIRHQILPEINKRWPAAQDSISRSAELMKQADKILIEIASQDISSVEANDYPGVIEDLYLSVLDLRDISDLSEQRQLNLLRNWVKSKSSLVLSSDQLAQVYQDLYQKPDSNGLFELNNIQIRVFKGYLYLMKMLSQSDVVELEPTREDHSLIFRELGLCLEVQNGDAAYLKFKQRVGGEKIHQHNKTKSLKAIFQQESIPPWERDLIPLIFSGNDLIAVPGVVYADESIIQNCRLSKYMPENA